MQRWKYLFADFAPPAMTIVQCHTTWMSSKQGCKRWVQLQKTYTRNCFIPCFEICHFAGVTRVTIADASQLQDKDVIGTTSRHNIWSILQLCVTNLYLQDIYYVRHTCGASWPLWRPQCLQRCQWLTKMSTCSSPTVTYLQLSLSLPFQCLWVMLMNV